MTSSNDRIVPQSAALDLAGSPPRLAVELAGVVKSFGHRTVLRGIDLGVAEREVVVVIGGSGSGKSTMLRCIAGLELIDDGEIRIEGTPVQRATAGRRNRGVLKAGRAIRQEVGMVFQQFNLLPHMTVRANITLALRLVRRLSRAEAASIADVLLERVALTGHRDFYPDQLSGGQQQRV